MFQRISVVCGAVAFSMVFSGAPAEAQSSSEVVGRVGDQPVTMADLDEAWQQNDAASRIRMLQDLYDTRRRTLDIVIGDILVGREATARGVSRDELLAEELPSRTLPITEVDITRLYEQNRDAFGGRTQEQMAPEIRAFLEQQRPTQALYAFMSELRAAATDVEVSLDPPRTVIEVGADDPVFGPATASVEIIEFSDFQCPFCQQLTGTIEQLKTAYGSDIRLVFKDYPLPSHAQAFKAAEAGNCANAQGKFWELHDTMFSRQSELGVDDLKRHAGELGMDQAAFDTCLDSGRFTEQVNADLMAGQQYGVSSTPTVFINGRAVMGAAPYALFDEIIREELEHAEQ
ncbi:MAG: thioredoxin domain-containing protein [Vicinamibacterales bacterium]|jgi:protein-disulfide isomerase|nr:thioredoxin domain-containing protein [Vicinamibacterales bacterium]MDP7477929.1 thioredoxin domain-containing protein [Vicinamibacterales bacterium]MDP7691395.1 thioredoxin domain-containing protein [Vicinamibacterales bacterium]HJN43909.1 thioredoxin domain-containing protein [Vicinamibacterales bacterium]|tara:strand:- start:9176 stop:10210 length:1035 start_codon:yes stop_codon:yes gene_type:complete